MPVHVLLTKSDKLKHMASTNALSNTRRRLTEFHTHASIQLFSATHNTGLEQVIAKLDEWLQIGPDSGIIG